MIERTLKLPEQRSFFLFGPRQTGKSTLLKSAFPSESTLYYDLLRSEEYRRLAANPAIFREEVLSRRKGQTHVVMDEIQRIPDILSEIHSIMESPEPPWFCMSGSSARKLKRSRADLLAGRAWTLRLHPLTHRECGSRFSLERALRLGSLPSVFLDNSEEDARRTLKAYAETYLKEEIEAEALVRNAGPFLRFLPLAASESGNLVNYSNLARATGASYQTVKEHFQILEDTLLGFFLMPYAKSARKRLAKHPKFYFFDSGVQRALAGRLSASLERGTSEHGLSFERFLIAEILRIADYSGKEFSFSFYRTEAGAEADLVAEPAEGPPVAVEIKASDEPHNSNLGGLWSFREIRPEASLICACLAPRPRNCGAVKILPWQDVFEQLGL
ncbi:MAG: ATP-binding protein [Elusimicrobia bacterium]|nr:ATP-binding protein [Elusimicrobiota bacterium]